MTKFKKLEVSMVGIIVFITLSLLITACSGSTATTPKPEPTPLVKEDKTGKLSVTISGLPTGSNADILITGPNDYSQTLSNSQSLSDLEVGTYILEAKAIVANDNFAYSPNQIELIVEIIEAKTTELVLSYSISSGSLFVAITGLSLAAEADVLVTGPNNFSQVVTESKVLTDLEPGAYEIRTQDATTDDAFFKATGQINQSALINQGTTAEIDVVYDCQRVILLDFKLAGLIRDRLSKPVGDITCQDMALLENIGGSFDEISNLSGLQHAVNLKKLRFEGKIVEVIDGIPVWGGVSDLTPIASLRELEELSLHDSPINNLYPISGLANLKVLDLQYCSFTDISPLANLSQLKTLSIQSVENLDFSSLSSLKTLTNLGITASFSNLSFVEELNALENLSFGSRELTNIAPVASLSQLKSFGIRYSSVTDTTPLQSLDLLEKVTIWNSPISNLSGLQNKLQLKELTLRGLQNLSNNALNVLANSPKLEILKLSHASGDPGDIHTITIAPLSNLSTLKELELGTFAIADFSPLSALPVLKELNIYSEYNAAFSLTGISTLSTLNELRIFNTSLTNLSELENLTNLQSLELPANQITDISPLVNLTGLQELDLGFNEIKNIDSLANFANISNLDLSGNLISDITPLVNNPNFNNNRITLRQNCLELAEGSEDLTNVQTLESRDVSINDNNQKSVAACE